MVISLFALFIALGGTGYAATQLSRNSVSSVQIRRNAVGASEIRSNAVHASEIGRNAVGGSEIRKGSVGLQDLSQTVRGNLDNANFKPGGTGPQGPQGPNGPQGPGGAPGSNGTNGSNAAGVVGPHWSIIHRNTEQNGVAELTNGPFVGTGAGGAPPFGDGSLSLQTANSSSKIAFGNQVDFAGDAVADLNQIGFHVLATGEDLGRASGGDNMPSITFEIDPNGAGGTTTNYSSLVFMPKNSTANQWSGYIDATDASQGSWGLTGSQFNGTPDNKCGINGSRCSWDQVKAFLGTGTGATILTAAVAKGKDYEFEGAVDGLRINDQVFDFESYGVNTRKP